MSEGKEKKKFRLTLLIIFLVLLICAVGVFVLYKKGILFDNEVSYKYKFVKVMDYSEECPEGFLNVYETNEHYVAECFSPFEEGKQQERRTVLYDKAGKNVTLDVFGVDNIRNIEYIPSSVSSNKKMPDTLIVYTNDAQMGLYDKNFNQLVKIEQQSIVDTDSKDYFTVGDYVSIPSADVSPSVREKLRKNIGVYNSKGELVIPRIYDEVFLSNMYVGSQYYDTNNSYFFVVKDGKYGVIDDKNNIIIPIEYNRDTNYLTHNYGFGSIFKSNGKNYYILRQNEKFGLVDENNDIILDFNINYLFYYEYADVVIERIYIDKDTTNLNVYNLSGELKKVITLSNDFNANYNADFYKLDNDELVFYDNDFIYVLNKDLEYDKYAKSICVSDITNGLCTYLAEDAIYLKENNEKVKIYKISDDSLFMNDEFYYAGLSEPYILKNHIKGVALCKKKDENNKYSECGIIGYDGKTILDFEYNVSGFSDLQNNNEYISIEYDDDENKFYLKKYAIHGNCIKNREYNLYNGVIAVDSTYYTYNCTKIDSSFGDFHSSDSNMIFTGYAGEDHHYHYQMYDTDTDKAVDIENEDGISLSSIKGVSLNGEEFIFTFSSVYKIVKYK